MVIIPIITSKDKREFEMHKFCRPPECDCANQFGADFKRFDLANGDFEVWYYCKKDTGFTEDYLKIWINPEKYGNVLVVREK